MMEYRKIATLKSPDQFAAHLAELGIELPFDPQLESGPFSPLAQPLQLDGLSLANRFAVLPMEGWDGTSDGRPTEYTLRRWRNFGRSGAGLIWGGEAVAIRHDGRANPNQLVIRPDTLADLTNLREVLLKEHLEVTSQSKPPLVGLQLTHSGRYSKPNDKMAGEPLLAYDHPLLNPRMGLKIPSGRVLSDTQVEELVEQYIQAAGYACVCRLRIRILAIAVDKTHLSPGAANVEAGGMVQLMPESQCRVVVERAGIQSEDRLIGQGCRTSSAYRRSRAWNSRKARRGSLKCIADIFAG